MHRILFLLIMTIALPGCFQTFQKLAPQTAAGFEANGILGAFDGASGAVVARCISPEGVRYRVALDVLASEVGLSTSLAKVQEKREKACRIAGAVQDLTDPPLDGPLPEPLG